MRLDQKLKTTASLLVAVAQTAVTQDLFAQQENPSREKSVGNEIRLNALAVSPNDGQLASSLLTKAYPRNIPLTLLTLRTIAASGVSNNATSNLLYTVLRDSRVEVQDEAARTLMAVKSGRPAFDNDAQTNLAMLRLYSSDSSESLAALEQIKQLRPTIEKLSYHISTPLSDTNALVRREALSVIVSLDSEGKQTSGYILQGLGDSELENRNHAHRILESYNWSKEQKINALTQAALQNSDSSRAKRQIQFLRETLDPSGVACTKLLIENATVSSSMRTSSIRLLGVASRGNPQLIKTNVVKLLSQSLRQPEARQPDIYLRMAALDTISELAPHAKETLPQVFSEFSTDTTFIPYTLRSVLPYAKDLNPYLGSIISSWDKPRYLSSSDAETYFAAAMAADPSGNQVVQEIQRVSDSRKRGAPLSESLIVALGKLSATNAAAKTMLNNLLTDKNAAVRRDAASQFYVPKRVDQHTVSLLHMVVLNEKDDSARRAAVHALAVNDGNSKETLNSVLTELVTVDEYVGALDAFSALPGIQRTNALPRLLGLANSNDIASRRGGLIALASFYPPRPEALPIALRVAQEEKSPLDWEAAIRVIGFQHDITGQSRTNAVGVLKKAFYSPHPDVRYMAVRAFAHFDPSGQESLNSLLHAARSPDEHEAFWAVAEIGHKSKGYNPDLRNRAITNLSNGRFSTDFVAQRAKDTLNELQTVQSKN